jgi:hypothetical protein
MKKVYFWILRILFFLLFLDSLLEVDEIIKNYHIYSVLIVNQYVYIWTIWLVLVLSMFWSDLYDSR